MNVKNGNVNLMTHSYLLLLLLILGTEHILRVGVGSDITEADITIDHEGVVVPLSRQVKRREMPGLNIFFGVVQRKYLLVPPLSAPTASTYAMCIKIWRMWGSFRQILGLLQYKYSKNLDP
jgi:hypothetical protein